MLKPATDPDLHARLRIEAETLLQSGTTASVGRYSLSVDALNLLHRLSSDPRTAGDALKLLHELQVHQVELDLQNEEIQNAEQLVSEDLSHYRELYDNAPAAYILVDFDGVVIKANRAADDLFGLEKNRLAGDQMGRFLTAESDPVFRNLLRQVGQEGWTQASEISLGSAGKSRRPLRMSANLSKDRQFVHLICYEVR